MFITFKDEDNFTIKINNEYLNNIDLYNKEEINKYIKKIIKKHINKLKGLVILNVYLNKFYGLIIDVENNKMPSYNKKIDIKIIFHLDSIFLYKASYYNLKDLVNINKQEVYYYKNNYYLNLIKEISKKEYYNLLEISKIVYGIEVLKIITDGYKV